MKKLLVLILMSILCIIPVNAKEKNYKIISGDLESVGSEICFDTECFYIIENDGNVIKLLSKYNLLVGNYVADKSWKITQLENPTGIQDSTALGAVTNENGYNIFPFIGGIGYANLNYWDSTTIKYPIDIYNLNSNAYAYVEEYKKHLQNKGVIIANARLLSLNEAQKLGCNISIYKCNDAPSWVHSTSYWLNTAYNKTLVYFIGKGGGIAMTNYDRATSFGVRPVIEISTGYFKENSIYTGTTKNTKVSTGTISNNDNSVDIIFNDLEQEAKYETTIYNDTNEIMYVNYLEVENLSEKFIEVELDKKSENIMIEPNSSSKVSFFIKTKVEEGAGRNLEDKVILKFKVSDNIYNPNTFSNLFDLMLLTIILGGTIYFVRKNNHKKAKTLVLIGIICLFGIGYVNAKDFISLEINGKIKYESQNNIIASGTTLDGKQADYTNSKEVWAYYDKVKNVEVKSIIKEPKDYYKKFDLTENKTGRVMAYLVENNDKDTPYDLKIMSRGVVIANKDSSFMFSFPNTEKVEGLTNIDFRNATTMQGMFIGNEKVEELEVSAIPLDNVKDTSYMFYDNENLDITIKDFNTDHIEIIDDITYMTQNYLYDIVKKNAKSDKDIDYVNDVTSGNYLHYPSKDNQNPIYYYRGDIKDNSVIFGNFCWYMVRTTETGGIKLLYNGTPDENGRCIEKNQNSVISETKFSYNADSLQSIGYMNGGNFPIKGQQINLETSNYVYGSSITYDENTKQYTLNDTYQIDDWTTDWEKVLKKYLYTCFNETGVCNTVKRFITYPPHYNKETVSISYIDLVNGKNFDETIAMSQENKNNSTAKDKTEQWYAENLLEYTRYLEDTIWCNSRKFVSGPLANEEYNNKNSYSSYIEDSHRLKIQKENTIDFSCQKNDSFTVEEDNGNGALTYPIGLLTLDELIAIGSEMKTQNRYFINNKWCMWLMTPSGISGRTGYVWRFCNPSEYNGNVSYLNTSTAQTGVTSLTFIRPSISLKSGTQFSKGTGTKDNPYIIEKIER